MPKEPKSYAPRIPLSVWEKHRRKIRALFVDRKKTLSNVAEIMRKYRLHASESQYERQLKAWGIRKNRTRDKWRLINRVVQKRRRQGKDSAVLINGVEQSKKKLDQEFARSGYRDHGGHDDSLPGDVQVLTPPANTSMTDKLPDRSNSEEGTLSLLLQMAIHRLKQIRAGIGKRLEGPPLEIKLLLDNYLRKFIPRKFDLSLQTRRSHIIEQLLQPHRCDPEPDEGRELDSRLYDRSPSFSESWCIPSWESVGVTSEEWVSRGWNVFFGAWG